jgi:hypothetical protein
MSLGNIRLLGTNCVGNCVTQVTSCFHITHCGNVKKFDKLLSYLLGILNVEVFKSYGRVEVQENVNLQEDRVATDLCRHSARRPKALEVRLVMPVSKL